MDTYILLSLLIHACKIKKATAIYFANICMYMNEITEMLMMLLPIFIIKILVLGMVQILIQYMLQLQVF